MTQNIPLSDTWDDYGGAYLANYVRVVVSTSVTSMVGYSLNFGEGSLNLGYKAGFGGVSMTSTSSPVQTDRLCCTLWRAFSNLTQTSEAVFKLATTAGSATDDSFRQACVGVRVQGGVFDDSWAHERVSNVTGYFVFLLNTLAQGCLFVGVRMNAGAATVLGTITPASVGLPNNALALIPAAGRKLRVSVIGGGGNPNVSAYTSNADGSNEILLGTLVDSSASKITTAGRCLFGMTTDRAEAGGTKTATLCTYFRAVDDGPPLERLRDEWTRNAWVGASGQSVGGVSATLTDGNGVSGHRAQQLWACDIYGQVPSLQHRQQIETDIGNNRLRARKQAGDVSEVPFYMISTFAPECGKCLDRSIAITYVPGGGVPSGFAHASELFLMTWNTAGFQLTQFTYWIQTHNSSGPGGTPQWSFEFLNTGIAPLTITAPGPGTMALANNTPLTYRWLVSVTGTAPTRVWKFELRVNGQQVPFVGPGNPGWTVNGDGTVNRLESVLGALADNITAGSFEFLRPNDLGSSGNDPDSSDFVIDTLSDVSPACCTSGGTIDMVPLQIYVPDPSLFVGATLTGSIDPTAIQIYVPSPTLTVVENIGRDPCVQGRFAGAVAVQGAFAGRDAGRVG